MESNKNVFSWQQKVERFAEDTVSSGKLFQIIGAATGNALLPTVCRRTEGTAWQSVTVVCVHKLCIISTWLVR